MIVKDLLLKYALYSQWAHKRLFDLINSLSAEQQHTSIPSSFDSFYKTVYHIWSAESLWLGRLNLTPIKISEDPFNGVFEKLKLSLESVDQQLVDWFNSKEDIELTQKIHYLSKVGEPFNEPYDLLLTHVFNHNTYHNGQLVSMLRALAIDKIPATDFVAWARLTK